MAPALSAGSFSRRLFPESTAKAFQRRWSSGRIFFIDDAWMDYVMDDEWMDGVMDFVAFLLKLLLVQFKHGVGLAGLAALAQKSRSQVGGVRIFVHE